MVRQRLASAYTRWVIRDNRAVIGAPATPASPSGRGWAAGAARRAGWRRTRDPLGAILVCALLAYLALTPQAAFARDPWANDVRRHVILGVIVGAYALLLVVRRLPPLPTPLDLPVLAVVVAIAASVAGSLDRRVSLEWAITVLPAVPLWVLLADRRLVSAAALRRGVLLAAVVVSGFALASVWRQWSDWLALVRAVDGRVTAANLLPPTAPRVADVGSHPNVIAAVLAVSLPVFLLSVVESRGRRALLPAGGFAIVALALFFTLSRAAWAGAAAGLAVTAAGLAATRGWAWRGRGWRLAGGAAVLLALAATALASGRARPDWLFRDSLGPRADMRRVGIEIFRDHARTGSGPGMYVGLYPAYQGAYPFAAVHSHNVAVQVAADYGVAGLVAGGALLVTLAVLLPRRFIRGDPAQRRAVATIAGALVAVLVHGLADSPHLFLEVLVTLAAIIALASPDQGAARGFGVRAEGATRVRRVGRRSIRVPARVRGGVRSLPPLIALLIGLALIPIWWRGDRAGAAYERATRAAASARWDEAVPAAALAARRDPAMAAYHLQLGAALGARYQQNGDTADRDAAIAAYARGLALNPRNGAAQADLASLRLDAGDVPGAWEAIEMLRGLAGRDTLLQLAYAVLVQRAGSPDEAVETYAGVLALNPTLALTPFWRDDPFRAQRYAAIVDRALARAEEITGPGGAEGLRRAIRVFTGREAPRAETLRAALAASPDDTALQVGLARLLIAGGRGDEAGPLLRAAVARTGDSAAARAALGDWYAARGDIVRARQEWRAGLFLGDITAGDALGQSFLPGPVPAAVVQRQRRLVDGAWIGRFYLPFQTFRFTFLRREPAPIIRPGDWLDALPDDLGRWQADVDAWQAGR